ncbi:MULTISPECIES: DUF6629 family protein [unclassified Streptomyces]|uniref:DUF6629 family protein n=1 Tax=unclassified Streptomyces TaxID=2593676 RepID=UPI0031BB7B63
MGSASRHALEGDGPSDGRGGHHRHRDRLPGLARTRRARDLPLGALLISGDRLLRLIGLLMAAGALVRAALWRLEFAPLVRLRGGRIDADPGLDRPPSGFPLCTRGRRRARSGPVTPKQATNRSARRR